MLRFIAAFLFLALAAIVSIAAGDASVARVSGDSAATMHIAGSHAVNSACERPTGGERENFGPDCCGGLFCAAATVLAEPSQMRLAIVDLGTRFRISGTRLTGRNVAPATGPPKTLG